MAMDGEGTSGEMEVEIPEGCYYVSLDVVPRISILTRA